MELREGGATILFCSHAMYHVQALCSRALWLEGGRVRMWDAAARVTADYETSLVMDSPAATAANNAIDNIATGHHQSKASADFESESLAQGAAVRKAPDGTAVITGITARADGVAARELAIHSGQTTLDLHVQFACDPALPCPSVAIGIAHASGVVVASAGSSNDGVALVRDADGTGEAWLTLPRLPLLKGDYSVTVILACERGLHAYEIVERALTLRVVQSSLEQGLVTLPHHWNGAAPLAAGEAA